MRIQYVGVKEDGETAFSRETNITWFPGSVEDVPEAIAKRMLNHPDVFAEADAPGVLGSAKAAALKDADPVEKDPVGADQADTDAAKSAPLEPVAGAAASMTLAPGAQVQAGAPVTAAVTLPDGVTVVLDGKSKEDLHALAKQHEVSVHPNAGVVKVIAALVAAFPVK